jgi:hypothetical protein
VSSPLQFGVLLADGQKGPFRFELQYIRAIRDFRDAEYSGMLLDSSNIPVKKLPE